MPNAWDHERGIIWRLFWCKSEGSCDNISSVFKILKHIFPKIDRVAAMVRLYSPKKGGHIMLIKNLENNWLSNANSWIIRNRLHQTFMLVNVTRNLLVPIMISIHLFYISIYKSINSLTFIMIYEFYFFIWLIFFVGLKIIFLTIFSRELQCNHLG